MKCPFCGSDSTKVKDTRPCKGDTIRKRVCTSCSKRFSTAERITAEYMQVRKRDGRSEPFTRAKIRKGILKAAAGSDLSAADLNAFIDRVVQILQPDASADDFWLDVFGLQTDGDGPAKRTTSPR